jgi:outer membrane lipoprotein SlyB
MRSIVRAHLRRGWAAMIRNFHRRAQVPGLGLTLGAAIGVVLGTLVGGGAQAALGVVIGAALGLLIGAAVQAPWASHCGR